MDRTMASSESPGDTNQDAGCSRGKYVPHRAQPCDELGHITSQISTKTNFSNWLCICIRNIKASNNYWFAQWKKWSFNHPLSTHRGHHKQTSRTKCQRSRIKLDPTFNSAPPSWEIEVTDLYSRHCHCQCGTLYIYSVKGLNLGSNKLNTEEKGSIAACSFVWRRSEYV